MAFGSIELTTISRAQDYAALKHQEDNKGLADQAHIGQHIQNETKQKNTQVHSSDNSDWHNRKFDAKEKGEGQYAGDGGEERKKEQKREQGRVVKKGHSSFDVKI